MIHIISFVFRERPDSENAVEQTPGKRGIYTLTPFFWGGGGVLHLYCVSIALTINTHPTLRGWWLKVPIGGYI